MKLTTSCTARMAVTAGLGLALVLGGLPTPSYAADEQPSITIVKKNKAETSYQAFQVFAADVSEKDEATHVAWPSDAMRDTVLAFLDGEGYGTWLEREGLPATQAKRAQNALEFVALKIDESSHDESASEDAPADQHLVRGGSFANKLARHLVAHGAPSQSAAAGKPFMGPEGYWLFVTQPTSLDGPDTAATAPLWITMGGSTREVVEKTSIPTVTKEVMEDATGTYGTAADAQRGQKVPYRIVGTLPANFAAYEHYHYRFEDHLSAGLELALDAGADPASACTVMLGDEVVQPDGANLAVTWSDHRLCIDFADLASDHWDNAHIDASTKITVEYKACLTSAAALGGAGNENDVIVRYSNDPLGTGEGVTTPPPTPKLFTYALRLVKVDEQTGEPLPGTGFTMQVSEENTDEASCRLYVQEDGSLDTEPHEFVTSQDGTFTVEGVDEGIYVISETTTPQGYEKIDQDITVTLSSTLASGPAGLKDLAVTVAGGERLELGSPGEDLAPTVDAERGIVSLTVTNDKLVAVPLTGLAGLQGDGLGVLAASASAVLLVARRRHMAKSAQN